MKSRTVLLSLALCFIAVVFYACENENRVFYRVQQDGLYGFIDGQGNTVIEPQYKYVSEFSKEGIALVINQLRIETDSNSHRRDSCIIVNYGYINKKNQRVNDGNTMKITPNALSFWGDNGLYGMAKSYNEGTLDFRSTLLSHLTLSDGLFLFQDEITELFGYKNIKSEVVIEPEYDRCYGFHNGVAIVFEPTQSIMGKIDWTDSLSYYRILNSCGAINTNGDLLIDYEYSIIQSFMDNGTTWAMTISPAYNGNATEDWVNIDKNGSILSGPIGSGAGDWIYNNKEYPIYQVDMGFLGTYYTFIDKSGNWLSDFDNDGEISLPFDGGTPELFKDAIKFSEGIAGLYANYRNITGWYYIDNTLLPISRAYDSILAFSENMSAAKELSEGYRVSKWGFVKKDPSNNTIVQAIPFSFSECGSFHDGLAYFSNEGNAYNVEGYINKEGDVVWQTKRKKF